MSKKRNYFLTLALSFVIMSLFILLTDTYYHVPVMESLNWVAGCFAGTVSAGITYFLQHRKKGN